MKDVSLLGQYEKNYNVIFKKNPSWSITKTERMRNSEEELPQSKLRNLKL